MPHLGENRKEKENEKGMDMGENYFFNSAKHTEQNLTSGATVGVAQLSLRWQDRYYCFLPLSFSL